MSNYYESFDGRLTKFLAALTLIICACVLMPATSASQDKDWVTVRVNVPGHLSDAAIFIARDMGYFAEEKIRLAESRSTAPDSIPLLASGQLDVTGGAVSTGFINSLNRGIPIKVVADKGSLRSGFPDYAALVVPPKIAEKPIDAILRELKGKKIAANCIACAMEYMVAGYLETVDLDINDVDLLPLGGPAQMSSLQNGAIAAAHMLEPAITQSVNLGIGVPVLTPSEVGQESAASAVLIYSEAFSRTEAADRFMRAYLRGARDYTRAFFEGDKALREAVVKVLLTSTTVKDPTLFDRMRYAYIDPNGEVNVESLIDQQEYYVRVGKLASDKRVDFTKTVDHQFVQKAVQQLGRWEEK